MTTEELKRLEGYTRILCANYGRVAALSPEEREDCLALVAKH